MSLQTALRGEPAAATHTRRRHARAVLVGALVGAAAAALLAWPWLSAGWTATGTVRLSEITGNRAAFEYNAFGQQLERALDGRSVERAVAAVVPDGEAVVDVSTSRRADASRVVLRVTATDEQTARDALLAAGRTAYRAVVSAERESHADDEQEAQARLDAATRELAQLRLVAEAQGQDVELSPLYRPLDQAVGIAVADLSSARAGLALADAVTARLDRSGTVTVDQTVQAGRALALLRVVVGGALAGAAVGAVGSWSRSRRRTAP